MKDRAERKVRVRGGWKRRGKIKKEINQRWYKSKKGWNIKRRRNRKLSVQCYRSGGKGERKNDRKMEKESEHEEQTKKEAKREVGNK